MKSIRLKDGKERSLLRRHPWVFDSAIAKGGGDPGETVRVRTTRSTDVTKILPSPILPVRAAFTMASTQLSTSSSLTTTSTLTLGKKSTTYSAPR
eukprot:gene19857-22570_t